MPCSTGENRYRLLAAAQEAGFENFSLCSDFETAVRVADREARPGTECAPEPGKFEL